MKSRSIQIFLAVIAFSFIVIVGYELLQWYSSYTDLLEARKTTLIPMEKIILNNKLVAFNATVNMTPAKWRYHKGLPKIIIDGEQDYFAAISDNREIEFELIDNLQRSSKIIVLNKDIRKCFEWMQEKLNISVNSRCFSPIRKLENEKYELISYKRGINIIKFTFSPPLVDDFDGLRAFI